MRLNRRARAEPGGVITALRYLTAGLLFPGPSICKRHLNAWLSCLCFSLSVRARGLNSLIIHRSLRLDKRSVIKEVLSSQLLSSYLVFLAGLGHVDLDEINKCFPGHHGLHLSRKSLAFGLFLGCSPTQALHPGKSSFNGTGRCPQARRHSSQSRSGTPSCSAICSSLRPCATGRRARIQSSRRR